MTMLSGVQIGNGIHHDEYDIHVIAYVHPYRKDNIFMQRQLLQSFTYTWKSGQETKCPEFWPKMEPFLHLNLEFLKFIKYHVILCIAPCLHSQ